jgi:hypothetical protein
MSVNDTEYYWLVPISNEKIANVYLVLYVGNYQKRIIKLINLCQ